MINSKYFQDFSDNRGFSLIEILVVSAVIIILTTVLLTMLARSRVDLTQGVNMVTGTVRLAQEKTLASTKYNASILCGYGVHYIDSSHWGSYAGPVASLVVCSAINRNYGPPEDILLDSQTFTDRRIEFVAPFSDVFFEPPDPKTYLNNSAALNQPPLAIQIRIVGGTCPQDCKTINVYPSGKIEAQ